MAIEFYKSMSSIEVDEINDVMKDLISSETCNINIFVNFWIVKLSLIKKGGKK